MFQIEVEIEEKPISLSWRKIIENLSSLVERGVVQGFEKILIEDFLEFIDNEYTQLNPYTIFALCKDNSYLLRRRCIAIMESSGLGEVKYHCGWKDYIAIDREEIKMIALSPCDDGNEWSIKLEMYPGDTMRQARNLYNNIHKDKLTSLEKNGWTINPNMHFSFQASNLVWTNVKIDIYKYVDYWINNKDSLNQVQRNDFQSFFSKMKNEGMISDNDWEGINNNIINTKMQTINVCPGIGLIYEWPKKNAIDLDKGDRFVDVFKEKVKEAMDSWR